MIYKSTILIFVFLISLSSCNRDSNLNNENGVKPSTKQSDSPAVQQQNKEKDTAKTKVNDSTINKTTPKTEESITEKIKPNKSLQSDKTSNWNWWMIFCIVLIAINLLFIWRLKVILNIKDQFVRRKDEYKEENSRLKRELDRKKLEIKNLKEKNVTKHHNKNNPKDSEPNRMNTEEQKNKDEISPEIALSPEQTNTNEEQSEKTVKEPLYMYAEKANESGVFSNISNQMHESKSIFKLYLEDKNDEVAQFELVDSEFILKMVANSPDIYLYSVCEPENSNRNFDGEIITTKKGFANMIEGKWKVKKGNKATIKFQ